MNKLDIIPMTTQHLDKVSLIESVCFSNPWSKDAFKYGLENNNLHTYLTAIYDGEIVGYICLFHIFEDGEILNVATSPEYRQRGIAQSLLNKAFELFAHKDVTRVTLEVRPSNRAAHTLYIKNGFHPIAVRKNYYTLPTEDGLVMEKTLERDI